METRKFQKFHLSTVISFVFFTLFVTLLVSSALWFYNSTIKTIQSETKNYFKQNKKIVEIVLDNYANNLSDLTRQISNKYEFDDSHSTDDTTRIYLEKMLESNVDNRLDFMFVSFNDGKTIDVSLTIFDTRKILESLKFKKKSNGAFFDTVDSNGEKLAILVSKQEIIDSLSGHYLGDLYAGIILNDSFPIVGEIHNKLEVESLSFIVDKKIIASSSTSNSNEYKETENYISNNTNDLKLTDDLIIKADMIKIKNKETSLKTITIIKDDIFDKFQDEFIQKFMILFLLVVILFFISYKMIKKIIELPLNKLVTFASKSIKPHKTNKFSETRIEEFNELGLTYEKLITKIKKMNNKLEDKVKQRTAELEESNDELQFAIENLKNTQDRLVEAEKMASLGGLVAGVAHEINTPVGIGLTGITHFLRITEDIKKLYTEDYLSKEELEEYLNTSEDLAKLINTNLSRTANLVKSFKQVAVDQTSEEKRVFGIKAYINEVLFSINNITKQTNLQIDVHCNDDITVNSYPGAIAQIITNFIINSIKHGFNDKEEGLITIEVDKTEDEISFVYKDNGKGIKEENMDKVFEPFFTTNRESGGTGLGLNIVYNIVTNSLSGRIKCNSEYGHGVEFVIIFRV